MRVVAGPVALLVNDVDGLKKGGQFVVCTVHDRENHHAFYVPPMMSFLRRDGH